MAIADLILRETVFPPLTTKGSELDYSEHDANIIEIYNQFVSLISGGGLTPYAPATPYTGLVYVSHNGNIWKHVGVGTSTGVTPGTNPAVWMITSIGELVHQQNTDQALDLGGAFEVAVADIYDIVMNQVISITGSGFATLVLGRDLKPNRWYEINDFATATSLYIHSIGGEFFDPKGVVVRSTPEYSAINKGLWSRSGTYVLNDYVWWDGYVYRNQTGAFTTSSPDSDGTNWILQSPTGARYESRTFSCGILFDGVNLAINWAWDERYDNRYGYLPFVFFGMGLLGPDANRNEACTNSSIEGAGRIEGIVNGNKLTNSNFVFDVGGIMPGGGLSNNILHGSDLSCAGEMLAEVVGNNLTNCELLFIDGLDAGNDFVNNRVLFAGKTSLRVRASDRSYTDLDINFHGSNAEDVIDVSGLSEVDLELNGYPDIFGVIVLTSSNANETINRIKNGARIFPLIIKIASGLAVDFAIVGYGGVGADGDIIGNAGVPITLDGDKGEYMVISPIAVGGFDIWQVTSVVKN